MNGNSTHIAVVVNRPEDSPDSGCDRLSAPAMKHPPLMDQIH